jgi:hypothetical protein
VGRGKPVDAHVVVDCVALVRVRAKPVQVRQSRRNIHAGCWVEVGEAVAQFSTSKSHLTAAQGREAGYPAAWHLGNQRADRIVTNQLQPFKEAVDAFVRQCSAAAKRVRDFLARAMASLPTAAEVTGVGRDPILRVLTYNASCCTCRGGWIGSIRGACVVCGARIVRRNRAAAMPCPGAAPRIMQVHISRKLIRTCFAHSGRPLVYCKLCICHAHVRLKGFAGPCRRRPCAQRGDNMLTKGLYPVTAQLLCARQPVLLPQQL